MLNFQEFTHSDLKMNFKVISGICFLIAAFPKSNNSLLIWFTIFSFFYLDWLKSFAKNDGFWYPNYSLNILLVIFSFMMFHFIHKIYYSYILFIFYSVFRFLSLCFCWFRCIKYCWFKGLVQVLVQMLAQVLWFYLDFLLKISCF